MMVEKATRGRVVPYRKASPGENCVTLPSELQVRLRTIKDDNPPTHSKRMPDRHVVTVGVGKYINGKPDCIVLRSYFFSVYNEAEKQYACLIRQLM